MKAFHLYLLRKTNPSNLYEKRNNNHGMVNSKYPPLTLALIIYCFDYLNVNNKKGKKQFPQIVFSLCMGIHLHKCVHLNNVQFHGDISSILQAIGKCYYWQKKWNKNRMLNFYNSIIFKVIRDFLEYCLLLCQPLAI